MTCDLREIPFPFPCAGSCGAYYYGRGDDVDGGDVRKVRFSSHAVACVRLRRGADASEICRIKC